MMTSLKLRTCSGPLPTSTFDVLSEAGKIVGLVQVRHRPSAGKDVPEGSASHIYYEILPQERGKGHGKAALALALAEAERIGIRPVVVTCLAKNDVSRRIIESLGGKRVDACRRNDGPVFLKYLFAS